MLDSDDSTVLIYDAAPEVVQALMSGNALTLVRDGQTTVAQPVVRPIDAVPEDEVNRIFQRMSEKYGSRNRATDVFYRLLGGQRDRTVLILNLPPRR